MKKKYIFLGLILLIAVPVLTFAESQEALGTIFKNLTDVTLDVSTFFQALAVMSSCAFYLAGYIKLRKHRKSATKPISPAIIFFLLSIAAAAIAFIPTETGKTMLPATGPTAAPTTSSPVPMPNIYKEG